MSKPSININTNNLSIKSFTFNMTKQHKTIFNIGFSAIILFAVISTINVALIKNSTRFIIMGIAFYSIMIPFCWFIFKVINQKEHIIINEQGINFIDCISFNVPKKILWTDLSKLYLVINNKDRHKYLNNELLFILNNGKRYTLTIKTEQQDIFINQTTPNNLLEVIEAYYYQSIEQISPTNELYKKTQNDLSSLDLGKEVKHITYAALFIMTIAILLFFTLSTVLLDSINQLWWYISATIIVVLFSIWYMRHVKIYIIIPCLLIAATTAFLTLPVTNLLPQLIGTPIQTTFIITTEDNQQQTWQSRDNTQLYFTRKISPKYRTYNKEQQPHIDLTVYKTSFGLNAIDRTEYRKLFH
ncbi:hypothetical protein MTZ49_13770 [Entomomonas sp. E2T0]|uniref:hypothetical protein n=1 Tax=Entomomonas sp. E2T0 TaxID=2930213 RepID=UPI0022283EA0|nr:hypothetical protein [Entomomonas sp. E2T0]UYZ83649.1 hypothetical protein MTZ49_13770 [Entomomonas sp. E2T0]